MTEHEQRRDIAYQQALLFQEQKNYRAALHYYRIVLHYHHADGSLRSNNALWVFFFLSKLFRQHRRPLRSRILAKRVFLGFRKKLGKDHPDVFLARSNLAWSLHDAGQRKRSLRLYKQTLHRAEAVLGPSHLATLHCLNDLGVLLESAHLLQTAVDRAPAGPEREKLLLNMQKIQSRSSLFHGDFSP